MGDRSAMRHVPLRIESPSRRAQSGAVLFVSLIFLLILTLLGVMLARMQSSEERMAQNDSNHELAVEAAEAALRLAEANIRQGLYTQAQFTANAAGLYTLNPAVGSVYTPGYDWAAQEAAGNTIGYNGPALASVPALPASQPQFIIENLPSVALPGANIGSCGGYNANGCTTVFQITTHATGGDATGNATLRSIYQQE
jgi:type IV pilus assembly protein PilX